LIFECPGPVFPAGRNLGSIYGSTVNNSGQIAYLINHFGSLRLDADHSAGLQLAIWELECGNKFNLIKASKNVSDDANNYLGYVTGTNSGHVDTARWLDPTGQTTWCENPQGLVAAAPEPASVVMLGGAAVCFGGYFWVRRWFRPGASVLAH
jgi:hypothetical protein